MISGLINVWLPSERRVNKRSIAERQLRVQAVMNRAKLIAVSQLVLTTCTSHSRLPVKHATTSPPEMHLASLLKPSISHLTNIKESQEYHLLPSTLLHHHQVRKLQYKTHSIKYYTKHQQSCPTVAQSGLGLPRTDGNAQIALASRSQETLWAQ